MPKIRCRCNEVIPLQDNPSPHQWLIISDETYDAFAGQIDAEKLYLTMTQAVRCPRCARLYIYWDGFREPPEEFTPATLHNANPVKAAATSEADLHTCRVCGLWHEDLPWGEDGATPSFDICVCCGAEFGYQDFLPVAVKRYRQRWLREGAPWWAPKFKPDDWSLAEQMTNVPREYSEAALRSL